MLVAGLGQRAGARRRTETSMLGPEVKRKLCNCKNSKCLKLYCECFAAGMYARARERHQPARVPRERPQLTRSARHRARVGGPPQLLQWMQLP